MVPVQKKIPLSQKIAVIPLVILNVVLHNSPPLSGLPHTNHEGFQREVQVYFSLCFVLYYFVLYYSIVIIFI